jgi:hypothetical protein
MSYYCPLCTKVVEKSPCLCEITVFKFLIYLRDWVGVFPNADDKGKHPVSNKQILRWVESGAIRVAGVAVRDSKTIMQFPIDGISFFSGNRRVSI